MNTPIMSTDTDLLKDGLNSMGREKELEYALQLMVYQYCVDNNALSHSFMCAGETAFRVLGITLETTVSEIERRIDELESEGY